MNSLFPPSMLYLPLMIPWVISEEMGNCAWCVKKQSAADAQRDACSDVEENLGILRAQFLHHADERAPRGLVRINPHGMAVVRLVAPERGAIQLVVVDAVFLLVLQHRLGKQTAVVLAGDAQVLAVGSDLHARGFAGGDAPGPLIVPADGSEPYAQVAVDALERRRQVGEAVGKALLVDLPELVHIVPSVVEHEGIEVQSVQI